MDDERTIWLNATTPQILFTIGLLALALALLRRVWLDRSAGWQRLLAWAGRAEMFVLAALIGMMIVFSALQIVLRNFAGAGLLWIDPLLRSLTLWIGFLGAAFATAAGRHIQIDVLARLSPPGVRAWASRVVSAFAAVITLILAETAYRHVLDEYAFGATAFLDLPTWASHHPDRKNARQGTQQLLGSLDGPALHWLYSFRLKSH